MGFWESVLDELEGEIKKHGGEFKKRAVAMKLATTRKLAAELFVRNPGVLGDAWPPSMAAAFAWDAAEAFLAECDKRIKAACDCDDCAKPESPLAQPDPTPTGAPA